MTLAKVLEGKHDMRYGLCTRVLQNLWRFFDHPGQEWLMPEVQSCKAPSKNGHPRKIELSDIPSYYEVSDLLEEESVLVL